MQCLVQSPFNFIVLNKIVPGHPHLFSTKMADQKWEKSIKRFHLYHGRLKDAANEVIKKFLYLVRPDDGFPVYSDIDLQEAFDDWLVEDRAFRAAMKDDPLTSPSKNYSFPTPPEHPACRRMWGLEIQRMVEDEFLAGDNLPGAIDMVLASPECASHPETCFCKSLYNRWSHHENLRALEALLPKKNAFGATLPLPPATKIVHSRKCACGVCYKKRVEDGTADAFMLELQENSERAIANLIKRDKERQAAEAALRATARAAGDTIDDNFVKSLFKSVQGVNHDDKCPHGIPFYACMSCSH